MFRKFARDLKWLAVFGLLALSQGGLEGVFAFRIKGFLSGKLQPAWKTLAILFAIVTLRAGVQFASAAWQSRAHRQWQSESFDALKPGLQSWRLPWHRDPANSNLGQALHADLPTVVAGQEAAMRCLGSALHAAALLVGLLWLSPVLAALSLLLVLPIALATRGRRKWLDGLSSLARKAQVRFGMSVERFRSALESAGGNRRVEDAWKYLSRDQALDSAAEIRWRQAQFLMPALLEWFYFALLAALLFWAGPRFGGVAEPAGALTLLLLLYQPVREFGRHWPGTRSGQKAHAHMDSLLGKGESSPDIRHASDTLSLTGLSFRYSGGSPLIKQLTLELPPFGWTCIRGPNGSGKSTLIRLLAGLEKPDSGSIIHPVHWKGNADAVGYLPQVPAFEPDFFDWLSDFKRGDAARWEFWKELMGLGFLETRAEWNWDARFSGGERQRLALFRVLSGNHEYLLLDEPGTGIPAKDREKIFAFALGKGGMRGGVVVSHDPWFAELCRPDVVEL